MTFWQLSGFTSVVHSCCICYVEWQKTNPILEPGTKIFTLISPSRSLVFSRKLSNLRLGFEQRDISAGCRVNASAAVWIKSLCLWNGVQHPADQNKLPSQAMVYYWVYFKALVELQWWPYNDKSSCETEQDRNGLESVCVNFSWKWQTSERLLLSPFLFLFCFFFVFFAYVPSRSWFYSICEWHEGWNNSSARIQTFRLVWLVTDRSGFQKSISTFSLFCLFVFFSLPLKQKHRAQSYNQKHLRGHYQVAELRWPKSRNAPTRQMFKITSEDE